MRTHTHTHTRTHSSMLWPLHFFASLLPSLAFTAKAILREKNLTPRFPGPCCLAVTIPEEREVGCLCCWWAVMSWPGFPTSRSWGLRFCSPPHPVRGGASHRVFFSSNLSSTLTHTHIHTHTHTHTASLSPGPLPSCLPYGGAPFSHHRPQTHACKAQEDVQYTAEAATGTPGGPGLPHVATSATHSPAQPTQVYSRAAGARGSAPSSPLTPAIPYPLPPWFPGRGYRSPGQCVFSQEPFTWPVLSPCLPFHPPQPAPTPPSQLGGDVT